MSVCQLSAISSSFPDYVTRIPEEGNLADSSKKYEWKKSLSRKSPIAREARFATIPHRARSCRGQICNAICARVYVNHTPRHATRSGAERSECVPGSTKGARQYSFKTESSERESRGDAREGRRRRAKASPRASNSGRPCCRLPTAFL